MLETQFRRNMIEEKIDNRHNKKKMNKINSNITVAKHHTGLVPNILSKKHLQA